MPTFNFLYFEAHERQRQVETLVAMLPNIWPSWVHHVTVCDFTVDEEKPRQVMHCAPEPERHRVCLGLHPPFYQIGDERQFEVFVHEICHTLLGNYDQWFQQDVLPFVKDHNEDLHNVFKKQYMRLWESTTVELEHIFLRALPVPLVESRL